MKDDKKNVDIMKWLKANVATKKDLEKELKPIRKELGIHGERLDSYGGKLDNYGERLDGYGGKLDSYGKRLDSYGGKLDSYEERLDGIEKNMATKQDMVRVYESLSDHEMRLTKVEENMATKQDLVRIYETLDKISEFMARHEQEGNMTTRILERLDKKVEEHDVAIRQMKPKLGLA